MLLILLITMTLMIIRLVYGVPNVTDVMVSILVAVAMYIEFWGI